MNPAPNVPDCTCDRDDDSWVGEGVEMPMCPYHAGRLRHLSWESLACMVIDYEAALEAAPVWEHDADHDIIPICHRCGQGVNLDDEGDFVHLDDLHLDDLR